MPCSIRLSFKGASTTPFFTTNTFDADASERKPSRNITASIASCSAASWRINTLPRSEIDLMSQRCQRLSTAVTQAMPLANCAALGVTSGFDITNTVGLESFGNAWSRAATPRVT